MKYENKSFTNGVPSDAYRDNWEDTFSKDKHDGVAGKGYYTIDAFRSVYVYVTGKAEKTASTVNIEGTNVSIDLDAEGNVVGVEVY